jgi:uncharacterized protein YrrD
MKMKIITAVSALALISSAPAFAETRAASDVSGDAAVSSQETTKNNSVVQDVKNGLAKADKSLRETADDIHAFIIGRDRPAPDAKLEPVLIHRNMTAHGMLGETVVSPKGDKIATVKDIIVDKDGKAILVVVSDGGVLGIGKKVAAFDYGKVISQKDDGKVVMALSQDMIDHAADFSYDQSDRKTAKVIPADSLSVNEILDGDVLDYKGRKAASVENVYFKNGDASQIIIGFNKTLGMGGSLAALDYKDLELIRDKEEVDFKMNEAQTAQFEGFKKNVKSATN